MDRSPAKKTLSMTSGNLFEALPHQLPAEVFTELAQGRTFRLERIVSTGQATPPGEWFDQADDEWVILLSGSATLQSENEPQPRLLRPGDWLHFPAHLRHRVEATAANQPTVWLALHFEPASVVK